jgi:GrpB-like predicted nucleotidyltransferase (UPF0157 family)
LALGDDEVRLRAATIGELELHHGPITLVDYQPEWPLLFAVEAERIRDAIGNRVIELEHVGSTAVPGLAAKPVIDVVLAVADSSDEPSYLPSLEAAGYVLRIREPEWCEHRMFRDSEPNVNLHVFSADCDEVERMIRFRDHLRANEADRRLYEQAKRELAQHEWRYVQSYADAKSAVVNEILAREASS